MKPTSKKVAPLLSLTSQGLGVLQLLVLLLRTGPTNVTDIYFYLFNMGMLPTQIIIVGVLLPMLLNAEKITLRAAKLTVRFTPYACLFLVILGSLWMYSQERIDETLGGLVAVIAINALVQAAVWTRAVSAEATGDPRWISGIAIPANTIGIIALLLPLQATLLVTAMVIGLIIGNGVLLTLMHHRKVGEGAFLLLPHTKTGRGERWFLTKSGIGYGGLAFIQSLAVLLPASAITILSVSTKLVGSLVATCVNALLPKFINQTTESFNHGLTLLRYVYLAGSVLLGFVMTVVSFKQPALSLPALATCLWVLASASNAIAQRAAYRFLRPNASRVTIIVVPAVAIAILLSTKSTNFQISTFLCAYALIDSLSATILLHTLRARRYAVLALIVSLSLSIIWAASLLLAN